jgi:hypothetical protein
MIITTLPYTQVDCLHQASPDGSQGARTPEKATVKSQQALIDVIVEAMPQQAAQLQASLSTLVTVAWLAVKPAFDETLRQYVVCVRDDIVEHHPPRDPALGDGLPRVPAALRTDQA